MEIRKIHTYTNSVAMQIKSDCEVMQNTTKVVNALHLFVSQIHSVHLIYGSMESIEVAVHVDCANKFIRLMHEINDHTNEA